MEKPQKDLEFFTVFDSKARAYSEPFPASNRDVVLRDFATAFKRSDAAEKNRYYQHAEDFSIFKCGWFDLRSGKLVGEQLEHVANLHDIRALVAPANYHVGTVPPSPGIVPT